jgi:hypothetical protein
MSVSTTVVSTQPGAVLQTKPDRSLNHQIIDGFERLRRQPIEAAVEGVMFGHRIAVEIGELTQRHTVGDPFAQLTSADDSVFARIISDMCHATHQRGKQNLQRKNARNRDSTKLSCISGQKLTSVWAAISGGTRSVTLASLDHA